VRDLVSWGLVRQVVVRGERKQFFVAEKEPWKVFVTILREHREIDPAVDTLGSALAFAGPWSPAPIAASAGLAAIGLCCGHSVGLHRLLIHGSFQAPAWLERGLVWLAVLCGLGGPLSLLRHHEVRDWAQRKPQSHPWFGHAMPFAQDLWWQLVGHVSLKKAPKIQVEAWIQQDPFYRWLERYWLLQQLPLALLAYAFGGLEWLLWMVPAWVLGGRWMLAGCSSEG
jgi:fatty-acid desaturase